MSVRKINFFFKSNNLHILDYWLEQSQKIYFLRVLNLVTGNMFMINISFYDIYLDTSEFSNNNLYYIYKIGNFQEDYPEEMILYFEKLENSFPNISSYFLFHHSNYLMENRNSIFKIIHEKHPFSSFITIYYKTSLEWIYENYLNLEQILTPFHNDFFTHIQQLYVDFIQYMKTISIPYEKILEKIKELYEIILSNFKSFIRVKDLWIKTNIYHQGLVKKIKEFEDYSNVYSVYETNLKIKKKHEIKEEISKIVEFRKKVRLHLLHIREELFHKKIIFLYYTKELKKNIISLSTTIVQLEKQIQQGG